MSADGQSDQLTPRGFDLGQLSFDVVVAFLPLLLSYLIPTSATLDAIPQTLALVMVLAVQMTVAYYLGKTWSVYGQMLEDTQVSDSSWQFISFFGRAGLHALVGVVVLMMLWFWLPSRLGVSGLFSILFGAIVLICGVVVGLMNESKQVAGSSAASNPNTATDPEAASESGRVSHVVAAFRPDEQVVSSAAILPALAFFAALFGTTSAFEGSRGFVAFLALLLSVVVALLAGGLVAFGVAAFLRVWEPLTTRIPALRVALSKVLFPASVAAGLILWEHIHLITGEGYGQGREGAGALIGELMVTGVIPLRLVVLLAPPFRPIHAVTAVVAVVLSVLLGG